MLYATVRNRKIHVKKPDTVVQNGVKVDWLQLEMDDEWAEMDSIVCVFVARYTEEQTGDGGTKTLVEQEITKEMLHTFGQKVLVPWECLEHSGMLSVSCTGYVGSEKIMTTMYPDSFWQIVQNGPKSGDSSIEPTPSLYDQIVAAAGTANSAAMAANQAKDQLLQDKANGVFDGEDGKAATVEVGTVVTGSPEENAQVYATGTQQEVRLNFVLPRGKQGPKGEVNPSEIAQAVENYMAAHPIQETDPTVPAWAKQPEKPAYTAAEVHALPDTYTPPVDASLSETSTNPVQNKVVAAKLSEVESIAKGRATGHVFETETDMRTWIAANASALNLGDNLYIRSTDVPDYWWDGTSAQPLETQKIDLIEYAKKSEVPAVDATLTQSGQAADAAKVGEELRSLSEEIVTTSESKVSAHNIGTDTHSDIRILIQGLTDRLNALADSDDTTLDQLSEVVAYIKSNRGLIDAITTSKVSVSDIVDNLTTNVANKPLSAAQGVALKALIDAISVPDKLPNPNALTFTGAATGSYDGSEPMTVNIPIGGGGSGGSGKSKTQILIDQEITELTASLSVTLEHDFHNLTAIINCGSAGAALTAGSDGNAVASKIGLMIDTTSFSYNSRKVSQIDTSTTTWQTRMIGAEWSDDLDVFKRGFAVNVATTVVNAQYNFNFGGTSAMHGTLGTDDNAPRTGKTANIVVNGAYLNVGTRVVLWGEYYE